MGERAHAVPRPLAATATNELLPLLCRIPAGVADRGRGDVRSARHGGPRSSGAMSLAPLDFGPSCRLARSPDLRRRATCAVRSLERASSYAVGAARWRGTACVRSLAGQPRLTSACQSNACQHAIWNHHENMCSFTPHDIPLPKVAHPDSRLEDVVLAMTELCDKVVARWPTAARRLSTG